MAALLTVFRKELADHFTSWRFIILFAIVLVVGVFAIYFDAQYIRQSVTESRFVFLQLYTTSGQALPMFIFFIAFFMPIVGITLGFDAINSERNRGTLSRLLSQPIFRDAVINGKFLAGAVTITIMLTSIILLVAGLGLRMIGVPPSSEEAIRLFSFLIMSIIYGTFWLGLSILFSILFYRVATSALASIALWMLFIAMFVFPLFTQMGQFGVTVMLISPITLFWQIVTITLIPTARLLGQVMQTPSPLSLSQSMLLVWPHLVSIIALTVVCFAISYIKFMREEIRST
ncbi:MAG: ABC transporter permease [Dehalococcoidales bacterium]|nr:ABC transporter permease [Dehalococcoidales bacterium]